MRSSLWCPPAIFNCKFEVKAKRKGGRETIVPGTEINSRQCSLVQASKATCLWNVGVVGIKWATKVMLAETTEAYNDIPVVYFKKYKLSSYFAISWGDSSYGRCQYNRIKSSSPSHQGVKSLIIQWHNDTMIVERPTIRTHYWYDDETHYYEIDWQTLDWRV